MESMNQTFFFAALHMLGKKNAELLASNALTCLDIGVCLRVMQEWLLNDFPQNRSGHKSLIGELVFAFLAHKSREDNMESTVRVRMVRSAYFWEFVLSMHVWK